MTVMDEILEFNRGFVTRGAFAAVETDRLPSKKLAVVSCMDTRLTELLPMAMNLRNGDAKVIKVAGAVVAHPYGSVMRSILVAVYDLGVEDVAVVGHYDCGMSKISCERLVEKMRKRGVPEGVIGRLESGGEIAGFGVDLQQWLSGFEKPEDGVRASVKLIRSHPLMPRGVRVHGLMIDPRTGGVERVEGRE